MAIWWPLWLVALLCGRSRYPKVQLSLEKQLLFTHQTVAGGTSTEKDAIFKQNLFNIWCIMITPCPIHSSLSLNLINLNRNIIWLVTVWFPIHGVKLGFLDSLGNCFGQQSTSITTAVWRKYSFFFFTRNTFKVQIIAHLSHPKSYLMSPSLSI